MKALNAAAVFAGLISHASAQLPPPNSASKPLRIWERSSGAGGQTFADFYPVGNGRIGAMFNGGTASESYRINENSFWSGSFLERTNPDARETVKEMQKLVASGDHFEAENLFKLGYAGELGRALSGSQFLREARHPGLYPQLQHHGELLHYPNPAQHQHEQLRTLARH
jgi:hypothetical protein